MLAAVLLKTCQTVLSEMLCPMVYPPDRHIDHFRYRRGLTTHQASLSPIRDGNGSYVPSLANEIYSVLPDLGGHLYTCTDSPALLPTLQALQRQFRRLVEAQIATEQDGQDRAVSRPEDPEN
jgi:hypothetical protein